MDDIDVPFDWNVARFAVQSDDKGVMKRDLEMILEIVEMVLPPERQLQTSPE